MRDRLLSASVVSDGATSYVTSSCIDVCCFRSLGIAQPQMRRLHCLLYTFRAAQARVTDPCFDLLHCFAWLAVLVARAHTVSDKLRALLALGCIGTKALVRARARPLYLRLRGGINAAIVVTTCWYDPAYLAYPL